MTVDELKKLIKNESIDMEFKSTTGEIKQACKTLCAFLNCEGGTVFIGVKNDGRLIGQMVTDNTRLEIANELAKFEPPANIKVAYIPITDDKQVILFQVEKGPHKPYIYDGKPYEKFESSKKQMSQSRYHQLLSQQNQVNHSWERFIAEEYTLDDLDNDLIINTIRKSVKEKRLVEVAMQEDVSKVLQGLNLLKNGKVTNAAVALFGKRFLPDYPQCQMKMARFKGLDRHEFLDSEQLYGNIFELLERGVLFVNRHLPTAAKIVPGQLERVETPLIPADAIREAIINSCLHKNYNIYGGSIKLAIYDDKMEIINNGGLLPGITLEQIKNGLSELRNPLIGDILFRCRLIEGWGRGIKEIIKECKIAGDPEPEFECDENYFQVTFKFPFSMKPNVYFLDDNLKLLEKLNDRQRMILKILNENEELSFTEIIKKLDNQSSERTIKRDLGNLKSQGLIDVRGHAWTAVWYLIR